MLGLSIAALSRRPKSGAQPPPPPPPASFGPLDLGPMLAAWWDADDAASLTIASGVSQWSDKSGKGRHLLQATQANRPQRNDGVLNGRAGLAFAGSWLGCAAATAPVSAAAFSLFVVTSNDVVASSNRGVMSLYPVGATNDWNSPGAVVAMEEILTTKFQSYANGLAGATTPDGVAGPAGKIVASEFDAAALSAIRVNGALSPVTGSSRAGLNLSAAVNILVGSRLVGGINPATYGLNATLHEIVLVDGQPAAADRQKIEGYLAWRWGLQASLPASHPYRDTAP